LKNKLSLVGLALLTVSLGLIFASKLAVNQVAYWLLLAGNFGSVESMNLFTLCASVLGYALMVAGAGLFVALAVSTRFRVDKHKVAEQASWLRRVFVVAAVLMVVASLVFTGQVQSNSTATTGYYLATPYSPYDWLISNYSTGLVYAINGSNWANMMTFPTPAPWAAHAGNSTAVIEAALAATTSGTIYLKGVNFNYSLAVPENVAVIENVNGLTRVFANSDNSEGSPFTVSVDTHVAGYYLCQDRMGRVISDWTSAVLATVETNVANALTVSGGTVEIGSLAWTVNVPVGVRVHRIDSAGADIWHTSQFPTGYTVSNVAASTSLTLENLTAFPETPYGLLVVNDGKEMIISSTTGNFWKYDGSTYTLIFHSSSVGSNYGFWEDSLHRIWIAPYANGTVWMSSNGGKTFSSPFTLNCSSGAGFSVGRNSWVDMENGTMLIGEYDTDHNAPYVFRSDAWGVSGSWSLWLNFTAIFPAYSITYTGGGTNYLMRHIHTVNYFNKTGILQVNIGDGAGARGIWQYTTGDPALAASWSIVFNEGCTAYLNLEDTTLYAPDSWGSMPLYNVTANTWTNVLNPVNMSYSTAMTQLKNIAYDDVNHIVYFSTSNKAAGDRVTYQTLFASTTGGKSWVSLGRLGALDSTSDNKDVAVFKGYVYVADAVSGTALQRFSCRTQAEIDYINLQDATSETVYNSRGFSAANTAYSSATVTISNASLVNLLNNPSFETWATPPTNWTAISGSWTGTYTYGDGGIGYSGAHCYNVTINGYGGSPNINYGTITLPAGYYTYGGFYTTNSSYTLIYANLRVLLGATQVGIASTSVPISPYYQNTWRRIETSFLLTDTTTVMLYFYPVFSGTSITNYVNLTAAWDAMYLYKHDATELPNIPYSTGTTYSGAGSMIIGNQKATWTTLPTTLTFSEFSGYYGLQLLSGNLVNVTVTGTNAPKQFPIKP
jgi:hypothetical protein